MRRINPKSVLLAGIAMLAASLLTACGSSSGDTNANNDNVTAPAQSSNPVPSTPSSGPVTEPTQSSQPTSESNSNQGAGVVNYVDNHNGVTIFGSSSFGAFRGKSSHAPFGEKLTVTCYVTNATGQYGSVNALYLIKGGTYDGGWVPANVMLNSATAQLGDATTPSLDDRVPPC